MNWPIFTRILPLIRVKEHDSSFISNCVVPPLKNKTKQNKKTKKSKRVVQAYFFNNVWIRNHIMLVRHLMLEVNKGWRFRDASIILLLNTTPAVGFKLLGPLTSAGYSWRNQVKLWSLRTLFARILRIKSNSRILVGAHFSLCPIGIRVDEMGKTFKQITKLKKGN